MRLYRVDCGYEEGNSTLLYYHPRLLPEALFKEKVDTALQRALTSFVRGTGRWPSAAWRTTLYRLSTLEMGQLVGSVAFNRAMCSLGFTPANPDIAIGMYSMDQPLGRGRHREMGGYCKSLRAWADQAYPGLRARAVAADGAYRRRALAEANRVPLAERLRKLSKAYRKQKGGRPS